MDIHDFETQHCDLDRDEDEEDPSCLEWKKMLLLQEINKVISIAIYDMTLSEFK